MPICIASSRPATRALYSASLLVMGSHRAREYHRIPPSGEIKIRPTPALTCGTVDLTMVRAEDALLKYNFQYDSPSLMNITASSSKSQTNGELSGSVCAAKKPAKACPLIAF